MELILAVLMLAVLVVCWVVLPSEKHAAHNHIPSAAPGVQQRA